MTRTQYAIVVVGFVLTVVLGAAVLDQMLQRHPLPEPTVQLTTKPTPALGRHTVKIPIHLPATALPAVEYLVLEATQPIEMSPEDLKAAIFRSNLRHWQQVEIEDPQPMRCEHEIQRALHAGEEDPYCDEEERAELREAWFERQAEDPRSQVNSLRRMLELEPYTDM